MDLSYWKLKTRFEKAKQLFNIFILKKYIKYKKILAKL